METKDILLILIVTGVCLLGIWLLFGGTGLPKAVERGTPASNWVSRWPHPSCSSSSLQTSGRSSPR